MYLSRLVLLLLLVSRAGHAQTVEFRKHAIDERYVFRGLSVVDDNVAWVSGKNGIVGKTLNGGDTWTYNAVKGFEKMDFRTLYAISDKEAVIANAGSPAYILRTKDGGISWETVYTNKDSNAFFDGVDFWNDKEGLIYGDPINGRMLLLKTDDGGKTWQELLEANRPVMAAGEASFAASGTGIRCYGKSRVMISSGGKVSRFFVSGDKGKSWAVYTPPMIHGETSAGIFSLAFKNDLNGVIVGGDYLKNTVTKDHVFYTRDGGKTWNAPTAATRGQRECVEFVGNNVVLASGVTGMDVSYDDGVNWSPLDGQDNFAVVRKARKGKLVVAAGKGRLSVIYLK